MSDIASLGFQENSVKYQNAAKNEKLGKNNKVKGALQIAAGGYIGSKAITSGLRRGLGIRIEEHTTSLKRAKDIIKGGCILDPKFGGSASAKVIDLYNENSKKFVHITGSSRESIKNFFNTGMDLLNLGEAKKAKINKVVDTPIGDAFGSAYRKVQKLIYRAFSQEDGIGKIITGVLGNTEEAASIKCTKKDILSEILNVFTGHKSKTFYVSGDEKFFSKNFIPDTNDIALKTDKPLKVCRTKIGAMFEGLKKNGLSGIKQNKTRAIAGVAIFAALSFISYKLIKAGIEKFKGSKESSCNNE